MDDRVMEWAQQNKERVLAGKRRWRAMNADAEREKACVRYQLNKDVELRRRADYRSRNKDKVRSYTRCRYQENKEVLLEATREWRAANPERVASTHREWKRTNPLRVRFHEHRRRERLRNAAGYSTVDQIAARIELFGSACWLCGRPYEAVDHVIPLARGGTAWPANQRPICKRCNSAKGTKDYAHVPVRF
jgi:5-methylcytosine-specific restriction endonuclease McrA